MWRVRVKCDTKTCPTGRMELSLAEKQEALEGQYVGWGRGKSKVQFGTYKFEKFEMFIRHQNGNIK